MKYFVNLRFPQIIGGLIVFFGESMLFFETAIRYLEQDKENLAPLTIRTYYWNLKKVEDFRPELDCGEIDGNLIREYRQHLQNNRNKPNTINKALTVFRIFLNKMHADKIIQNDPFGNIKIGRVYTHRGFLTTNA